MQIVCCVWRVLFRHNIKNTHTACAYVCVRVSLCVCMLFTFLFFFLECVCLKSYYCYYLIIFELVALDCFYVFCFYFLLCVIVFSLIFVIGGLDLSASELLFIRFLLTISHQSAKLLIGIWYDLSLLFGVFFGLFTTVER